MLDKSDSTNFVPALTFAQSKREVTLTRYTKQTDQSTAELMLSFISRQLNHNLAADQRLKFYPEYVALYISNPEVYYKLNGPTHDLVREAADYAQEQYQPVKSSFSA